MTTIDEASFSILAQLMEIKRREGRWPIVTGLHSMRSIGNGEISIWLELEDPNANAGAGVIMAHVDERAIVGVDAADVLRRLMGKGDTIH